MYSDPKGAQFQMSGSVLRLFLHMPKCAGTSVRHVLNRASAGDIFMDYGNSFFRVPLPDRHAVVLDCLLRPVEAPSDKIVYGHFFPVKYLGSATHRMSETRARLVTILRDPVDRLRSHYQFFQSETFPDHYLWKKMKAENWGFEEFAFSAEMKNYYSQYLTQVPLGAFSYIGAFERLEQSIRGCLEALGIAHETTGGVPRMNSTPPEAAIRIDDAMRSKLEAYHSEDYLIYEYARRKFHV